MQVGPFSFRPTNTTIKNTAIWGVAVVALGAGVKIAVSISSEAAAGAAVAKEHPYVMAATAQAALATQAGSLADLALHNEVAELRKEVATDHDIMRGTAKDVEWLVRMMGGQPAPKLLDPPATQNNMRTP